MRRVIASMLGALLLAAGMTPAADAQRECSASDGIASMAIWNDREGALLYSVSTDGESAWTASALRIAQREAKQQLWTLSAPRDRAPSPRFRDVPTAPVIVAAPAYNYSEALESTPYSKFVREHAERPAVLYFGAAEGLVGLDARTGRRTLLFEPAQSDYVGGTPAVRDAFVNGRWRTVLVGGLGGGGKAIYALDVTDPGEALGGQLLWRFSNTDDADLGFTSSRPVIARVRSGAWVAIFGNGHDGEHANRNRASVLFVVDLASGRLIRKLATPTTSSDAPNGLSSPAAVDIDRDDIVDFVYAGDLQGHLWKFNLSSADSDEWRLAQHGQPLFRARDVRGNVQPILQRPEVTKGPRGVGAIVVVGAGAPISNAAHTPGRPHTHSLYGIVDQERGALDRAQLAGRQPRAAPARALQAHAYTTGGWFVDFDTRSDGWSIEELAGELMLRDGHVVVSTLRTSADGCRREGNRLTVYSFRVADGESFAATEVVSNETRSANEGMPGTSAAPATFTRARIIRNAPVVVSVASTAAACTHDIYAPGVTGIARISLPCERTALGRRSWMQAR